MEQKVLLEEELFSRIEAVKAEFNPQSYPKPWVVLDTGGTSKVPWISRITHATVKTQSEERIFICDKERLTVLDLVNYLMGYRKGTLVGFNLHYDLNTLSAAIHRLGINVIPYFAEMLDLRVLFGRGNKYAKGTLHQYAAAAGFSNVTIPWKKHHMHLLEFSDDIPGLKDYLLYDVRAVMSLLEFLCNGPRAAVDQ